VKGDPEEMTSGQTESHRVVTHAEALALVADIFETPPTSISAGTPRSGLAAWDSLGQLVLMSALDQQFGIRLTQEELASLDSVQRILDILGRHGRLAG